MAHLPAGPSVDVQKLYSKAGGERTEGRTVRSEVNSELNFPSNFEGLVLGCIDADFCK